MSYGSRFESIQLVYTEVTFVLYVHMVNVCGTHEGCEDGPENEITVYIFSAVYFYLGGSDVIVLLSVFCVNSITGETVHLYPVDVSHRDTTVSTPRPFFFLLCDRQESASSLQSDHDLSANSSSDMITGSAL
jgi:hypothetical protein